LAHTDGEHGSPDSQLVLASHPVPFVTVYKSTSAARWAVGTTAAARPIMIDKANHTATTMSRSLNRSTEPAVTGAV
jgi:hypothetical protein